MGQWGAGIAGRAARGSTNRKATCGPLPRSLDHAVQGCQPALLFTRRPPRPSLLTALVAPSTDQGGGKAVLYRLAAAASTIGAASPQSNSQITL